jgi:hypothetical protein
MQMIFDANATGVAQAYDQMEQGNNKLTRATIEGMTKAAQAIRLVTENLMENQTATKALEAENENLKKKLEELTEREQGVADGMKSAADGFKAFTALVAGNEAVKYIREIERAEADLNKELAKTQIEVDAVIRKFQVMAMMKDKDFMEKLEPQLKAITQEFRVSPETVIGTMTALKGRGVSEENLMGTTRETIGGAMASNIGDSEIPAFAVAQMKRAAQEGKDPNKINAREMRQLMLPVMNVSGGKWSGAQMLDVQQQAGAAAEAYGWDYNQVLGEIGVLSNKRGMSLEKATGGMSELMRRLDVIPESVQKLGDTQTGIKELIQEVHQQRERGNLVGALSAIDNALKQGVKEGGLSQDGADKILSDWFGGRRGLMTAKLAMSSQGDVIQKMGTMQDEGLYRGRLEIATGGASREEIAVNAQGQLGQFERANVQAHNRAVISASLAEADARGFSGYQKSMLKYQFENRAFSYAPNEDLQNYLPILESYGQSLGYNPIGWANGKGFAGAVQQRMLAASSPTQVREVTGLPTYGPGREGSLSTEKFGGFGQMTPEEKERHGWHSRLLTLEKQLLDYKEERLAQPHRGRDFTDGEKAVIKRIDDQIDIARRHLNVAEGTRREIHSAKNGLNN